MAAADPGTTRARQWIYRYPAAVRVSHWLNALCLVVLVMSGLQIFNAHPALYWGEDSDFERPLLTIYTAFTQDGRPVGITRILGRTFETTGVLGRSALKGRPVHRAFPPWLTIPSGQDLATGRRWHFFFAWVFVLTGAVYLLSSIASGRITRDLLPHPHHLGDIGRAIRDHVTFRVGRRHAAGYNVLQRIAYTAIVLVVAPLIVLTGLTMSPAITAAAPWLLDVFAGRQSARTLHFVLTVAIVLFAIVHVVMVLMSGFTSQMRSMITGWYAVDRERIRDEQT